jgi:hypothetical protein
MSSLTEKIVGLHKALEAADIPHGFGGALALAWCTQRARGTIDIDLNIFIDTEAAATALAALPKKVTWVQNDLDVLIKEGQVRIWWDKTPLNSQSGGSVTSSNNSTTTRQFTLINGDR